MSLITISSGIGCKSYEIAKLLSKKLEVELYDEKKIRNESIKFNKGNDYKIIGEKAPSLIERLLIDNPEEYYFFTESVILDIAHRGSGIILGHAAQMLLKDCNCVFKVKIHSPYNVRVRDVMKSIKVDNTEAEKIIKDNDSSQKKFFKYIFKNDFDSATLYDFVINTDKISVEAASSIIIDAVRDSDIKECSIDTLSSLKKTSIEKRIYSKLLKHNLNVNYLNIFLTDKNSVNVSGSVSRAEELEEVENIIKDMEGISSVNTDDIKIYTQYTGI